MLRGFFPREGLSAFEAAWSGLAFPAILIITASYLLLGSLPSRGTANASVSLRNHSTNDGTSSPEMRSLEIMEAKARKRRGGGMALSQSATLAMVVFPVVLVIDMPSMMLMACLRLPKWVFALLVLRALAR